MISAPDLSQAQLDSPLGRTSPVVKLAVAIGWLVALAFTLEPLPPVAVAILALGAGMAGRSRSGTWRGRSPRCGWRPLASACSTPCSRRRTSIRRRPSWSRSGRSGSPSPR